jgi:hypothetical protein
MNRTVRLLALAAALPLALSACNSGGNTGDTNVELGSNKKGPTAAGIPRDTTNRPTGKELFNAADRSKDKNHDGLAD